METPKVGTKVRFKEEWWYDPMEILPAGVTGIITSVRIDEGETEYRIEILIDQPQEGLEHEDNTMAFYPECGPQPDNDGKPLADTIAQFYYHCEIIK